MALVDHIRELRRRIIIALVAIVVGSIVGFIWYGTGISWNGYLSFRLEPLGEILRGPYCSLPQHLRADLTHDGECRLLATAPFEMFLLRLKVGGIAGIVLASPVWISQIWLFITPGLYKKERRVSMVFLTLAIMFFLGGAVLAYFVLNVGLQFLLTIGNDVQVAALSGHDYYNLVQSFLLIFGVCFEVPLIIALLNILGVFHYSYIVGKRRIIWVFIFIFGAVLSPGGEVTGMLALSLTVGSLIELAFLFSKINDKRRERRDGGLGNLDDEDPSHFHYTTEPIAVATGLGTQPVASSTPVQAEQSAVPDPVSPVQPVAGSSRPVSSPKPQVGSQPTRQPRQPGAVPPPSGAPQQRPPSADYTRIGFDDVL